MRKRINKRYIFILFSLLLVIACQSETKHIKNARYYGPLNPETKTAAPSIELDMAVIDELFDNLKRTEAAAAKGPFQYVTVETGNNTELILQVMDQMPHSVRIIKKDRTTNMWYEFKDQKSIDRWALLLKDWSRQLQQKQP
ncbi:hypothetical protein [Desertivirga xinjiangensis]|uniref:hypothetical protein n=1 Tax=Desertivirga xinjiangensis TaxID=539206 RepID=UPI00210BB2F0|nr:hypothetical protein [Pedobacter xinjiangensis]